MKPFRLPRGPLAVCSALALIAVTFSVTSCAAPIPNRDPVGSTFPSVVGESLEQVETSLPESLAGEPAILLVGYVQNAQFDIDRWLIGITQVETPVRFVEVPTIDGLVPGMFAGTIDNGMRSGIPSELWSGVVTLYGDDAARVVEAFGNERPRNGRVALLDRAGKIVWFHDRGFSPIELRELDRLARTL